MSNTVENTKQFIEPIINDSKIIQIIERGTNHFEAHNQVMRQTNDKKKAIAAGLAVLLLGFFPKFIKVTGKTKKFILITN